MHTFLILCLQGGIFPLGFMSGYLLKNCGDLLPYGGIFQDLFCVIKEQYRISFRRENDLLCSIGFPKPAFQEVAFDGSLEQTFRD